MVNKSISKMDDVQLLERMISKCDMDAFEGIYKRYEKQLSQYAFQFTKSRFITDEIIQEVFLKLWERRKSLSTQGSIKSYLYSMVRNRSLNYIRDAVQHEDLAEILKRDYLKAGEQPDHAIVSQEFGDAVELIIDRLPERRRHIFQLSNENEKSHQEIARELGITVKTVKDQLRVSMRFVQKHLKRHLYFTLLVSSIL